MDVLNVIHNGSRSVGSIEELQGIIVTSRMGLAGGIESIRTLGVRIRVIFTHLEKYISLKLSPKVECFSSHWRQ